MYVCVNLRVPVGYHSDSIIIHIASHLPSACITTQCFRGSLPKTQFSIGSSDQRRRDQRGEIEEREGGKRRGVKHFISLSSMSPSQAFNAPFSACPALCKIMLIPFPVLSHLYKLPFLPLKSNYISLRSCQKTGLACKYE